MPGTHFPTSQPAEPAPSTPPPPPPTHTGLVVRMPMTFLAMTGARLSLRERLFVAVAWTPKATVQVRA